MTLPKFEEWLAPWEVDSDGKALEEPAEVDAAKLKQHLYNLLADKEKSQAREAEAVERAEAAEAKAVELQRKNESEDERRAREDEERQTRYAELEKRQKERDKLEALEAHFADEGITATRAKALAKRVSGESEKEWIDDAKELVENGFRISDKPATEVNQNDGDPGDDVSARPRPVRSNGKPAEEVKTKRYTSVGEELDAAGIGHSGW